TLSRSCRSSQVVYLPSTGDSQQAAGGRSGALDAHSARILAYRASHSKPLQAGATLCASARPKNDAAKFRAGSTRWNSSLAQPLAQPPGSGQNVRLTSPESGRRNGQNETEIP